MARHSYVQDPVTLELVPRDEYVARMPRRQITATIAPDLPDFRSPIDGTIVRGRAGMRDHCKRHNVVPTADLAGLPTKPMNQEYKPDREAIRRTIADQVYRR